MTDSNHLSLFELNLKIREVIEGNLSQGYWVKAETSDVRVHSTSGHCYLEFVEKDPKTGSLLAKARGTIWAKTFRMLKPYFEQETKQSFTSGLKVLIKVMVEYHEVYGLNLTVIDIDPSYTIGDLARKRLEIIRQLQEEGIFTLNKELPFPTLPQRIAIITSPTAAGYEDFISQLYNNPAGYIFYTKLFPAIMQGEKTETSIIEALNSLFPHIDKFDAIVIIRGGGSTADLNSFDSYLLAANCAQYPLPIITGIGHERDDTILDLVAHTRMKTPTAVAEFLIHQMDKTMQELDYLHQQIRLLSTDKLTKQKNQLLLIGARFPSIITSHLDRNRSYLQNMVLRLPTVSSRTMQEHLFELETIHSSLKKGIIMDLTKRKQLLELSEQFIQMASPDYVLKRGYTITTFKGKIIKESKELEQGDTITTHFKNGQIESTIK